MSKPKRHHFVPRAHLARFGKDGRVAVRWRGQPRVRVSGAQNIAVEAGFYETVDPTGQASVEFESRLAKLEGLAESVIREYLSKEQVPAHNTDDRILLATLIAVQLARTPETRERVMFSRSVLNYTKGRELNFDLMAQYLEKVHLGFKPSESEIKGALIYAQNVIESGELPTKTDAIRLSLTSMREATIALLEKHWSMEVARKPRLITSDAPAVLWRKPSPRDAYEGMGIKNSEEIRFPLDAGHQLILSERPHPAVRRIEPARVRACNDDMASACHRLIVGHPDRPVPMESVQLANKRPTLRFNTGPGFKVTPTGEEKYYADILHMWIQRHARD